jgi:excisionase family DNA binding protein
MSKHTQAYPQGWSTDPEPLMTVYQTAAFLSISVRQVYNLIADGSIPTIRVGTRIRVVPSELRRALVERSGPVQTGGGITARA